MVCTLWSAAYPEPVDAILMHVRSHETVILTAHTDSLGVSKGPGYAISSHPSGMTRCWMENYAMEMKA